jgi:hypothetical protein
MYTNQVSTCSFSDEPFQLEYVATVPNERYNAASADLDLKFPTKYISPETLEPPVYINGLLNGLTFFSKIEVNIDNQKISSENLEDRTYLYQVHFITDTLYSISNSSALFRRATASSPMTESERGNLANEDIGFPQRPSEPGHRRSRPQTGLQWPRVPFRSLRLQSFRPSCLGRCCAQWNL